MARKPFDLSQIDTKAYAEADEAYRMATSQLPEPLVAGLAKEVVRRLSFRMPGVTPASGAPDSAEVERFCGALLAGDELAADRVILNARHDGVEIEMIYLGYIAGASRRLGEMWENDQVSFVDVSLATGRLYRIIRGLRHAIAPVVLEGRARTPAMFVLVPGEAHSLGIEIAVDLFRRDGGDADVCIGMSHDEIVAIAENRHHGVIVLVANSDRVIPTLVQLSVALRISQPLTSLALAGNLVDKRADAAAMIEAEIVVSDMRSAIPELRRLTERI